MSDRDKLIVTQGDIVRDPSVQVSVEGALAHDKDDTQGAESLVSPMQQALENIDRQYSVLVRKIEEIDTLLLEQAYDLESKSGCERLRADYSAWLNEYERYMDLSDQYVSFLDDSNRERYKQSIYLDRDTLLTRFKSRIERLIIGARQRTSRRHSVSEHSSRTASSVISKRIKEEQHRAELAAKLHALQEEEAIQMAELQLKLRRQKLQLITEHELSNVRVNALKTTEQLFQQDDRETIGYDETVRPKTRIAPSQTSSHVVMFNQKKPTDTSTQQPTKGDDTSTHQPRLNITDSASQQRGSHHGSETGSANSVNALATVAKLLKRPQADIQKFSGDPTQYRKFMRQFNTKVATMCDDDDERLTFLEQFTSGDAHKVVCGFSHLTPSLGYKAALEELKTRYGDEQNVADAYVQRALNWPVIKLDDVKGLDDYSIFLTECMYAISDVSGVDALEHQENMRAIVKRLPGQLHDRWRSLVLVKRNKNQAVHFKDLVKFVREEAKKARDVVYGRLALKAETTPVKRSQSKSKGVFCTTTSEKKQNQNEQSVPVSVDTSKSSEQSAQRKCLFCKGDYHPLVKCVKFDKVKYPSKIEFIKKNNLCFGCLKTNHMKKDCTMKAVCTICGGTHPTTLHIHKCNDSQSQSKNTNVEQSNEHADSTQQNKHSSNTQTKSQSGSKQSNSTSESSGPLPTNASGIQVVCGTGGGSQMCTMAIVPVQVNLKNKPKIVQTYAFLDPGSSVCFCKESLMSQLGGDGKNLKLTINTMGDMCDFNTKEARGLQISNLQGENLISLPEVYTKQQMPVSAQHIPTSEDLQQWTHLQDIKLPTISGEIGLLIGNNVPDVYTPLELRTGDRGTPHATRSMIGWILWNVMRQVGGNTPTVNRVEVIAIQERQELSQLDKLVRHSIDSEFPERRIDDKKEHSSEDKEFLTKVEQTIQFQDGHYYISLPFHDPNVVMPNNYEQAVNRLSSLSKRFVKDSKFKDDYVSFVNNMLEKGYAEKVETNVSDRQESDGKVWYLPHHGVMHPAKNTLRVVFDCSAVYKGVSLNQRLLQSPNLTNSLVGVLLRFRDEPVAIMGDVEAMYHQVRVPVSDRDYLRFLWYPDDDFTRPPEIYRMCVHLFGATSSPACAIAALNQTAKSGLGEYKDEVVNTILNDFYVDDCLKSIANEDQAISMVKDLRSLCQSGGFNVKKWVSNSRRVNESLPLEDRAKTIKHLDMKTNTLPIERALGVTWDIQSDTFRFKVSSQSKPATRRNVLSITSSIYDPLGFAAPCTLFPKMILRELCGQEWDSPLSKTLEEKWVKWQSELPSLEEVEIPRCVKHTASAK